MILLTQVLGIILLLLGGFFVFVGGVGVFRFPDFYTRLHGAGVTDTLGAGLILLGLMMHAGLSLATLKLFMILVFLFITSPTACHALAQAARAQGLEPQGVDSRSPK